MNLITVVYCWTFSCFRLWIYRSQIHSIGIYWHSHPISSFFSPFFLYIHFVCIFSIALLCCVEYIKHLNQIFYFYCITQKSIAICGLQPNCNAENPNDWKTFSSCNFLSTPHHFADNIQCSSHLHTIYFQFHKHSGKKEQHL